MANNEDDDGGFFKLDKEMRDFIAAMRNFEKEEDERRGWRMVFVEVSEAEYQADLREHEARAAKIDGAPLLNPGESVRLPPEVERQLPRMIMMREDIKTGARSPWWGHDADDAKH